MILNVNHQTNYKFPSPVPKLVQSLKLYPSKCLNQKILNWSIKTNIGSIQESYQDALGHRIFNIYIDNLVGNQTIISKGKVETKNYQGLVKGLTEKVNPLCFLRNTELTKPGKNILALSKKVKKKKDEIEFCHHLNLLVSEAISFK